jgi:hypothetical protein
MDWPIIPKAALEVVTCLVHGSGQITRDLDALQIRCSNTVIQSLLFCAIDCN